MDELFDVFEDGGAKQNGTPMQLPPSVPLLVRALAGVAPRSHGDSGAHERSAQASMPLCAAGNPGCEAPAYVTGTIRVVCWVHALLVA